MLKLFFLDKIERRSRNNLLYTVDFFCQSALLQARCLTDKNDFRKEIYKAFFVVTFVRSIVSFTSVAWPVETRENRIVFIVISFCRTI